MKMCEHCQSFHWNRRHQYEVLVADREEYPDPDDGTLYKVCAGDMREAAERAAEEHDVDSVERIPPCDLRAEVRCVSQSTSSQVYRVTSEAVIAYYADREDA